MKYEFCLLTLIHKEFLCLNKMVALISVAFHINYIPKVKVRTPNLGGMLIFKRAGQPRCRIRQVLRNLENLFQSENNPIFKSFRAGNWLSGLNKFP